MSWWLFHVFPWAITASIMTQRGMVVTRRPGKNHVIFNYCTYEDFPQSGPACDQNCQRKIVHCKPGSKWRFKHIIMSRVSLFGRPGFLWRPRGYKYKRRQKNINILTPSLEKRTTRKRIKSNLLMTPKITRCERRLGVTRIDVGEMHKQNKKWVEPTISPEGPTWWDETGKRIPENITGEWNCGVTEKQKKTTQETALTRSLRRGPVDRMAGAL